MIDTCEKILDREIKSGRSSLDDESKRVFHLYRFLSYYENGGISGLLYNLSPAWNDLSELASITADLNHLALSKAVEGVHRLVSRGPEEYKGTWEGWINLTDPNGDLDKYDSQIFDLYEVLWHDLERLTS
ncbi:hypothetical protein HW115_18665 [Verrucomicrobiaceae bacterium N1E253]|uniref:DNA mimic protein DMP19 C-terminal domain-containing protein n=1 Tax=Oceaniferula marina TaxID=2748318 RepID=A0A851GRK6_9BACT|nr:hypothetical protein [Oceaniferula marina]NWK57647.1 hypothetical protein [Oceaniferula marina]